MDYVWFPLTLRVSVIFALSLYRFSTATPIISVHPSNVTAVLGGIARFYCQAGTDTTSAVSATWIRYQLGVSGPGIVINSGRAIAPGSVDIDRYSIVGLTDDDFDLQIRDVKIYDSARYVCQVMEVDSSESIPSSSVFLNVKYLPETNQLNCVPNSTPIRGEAGVLSTTPYCTLGEVGDPPATLEWVREDGQNVSSAYRDPDFVNSLVLRFVKNLTIEDNGMMFYCVVRHPLLEESIKCQIGPFNVYHAPINASIASAESAPYLEGSNVEFQCAAVANPASDITFTWSTEPPYSGKTKLSYHGSRISFPHIQNMFNGTNLTCNATNSRGFSVAKTEIILYRMATVAPERPDPTNGAGRNQQPTAAPESGPDTYLIAFILIGVIVFLLLLVIVILFIGRKWREPVIYLDVNDEVCKRSLSGGGSLVFGSNAHVVLGSPHKDHPNLVQIHRGPRDSYSISSLDSSASHHHQEGAACHLDPEDYPSDPKKAAKLELGTEFFRSAHTSRHNSIDSTCSDNSHYEKSICSVSSSRPGTPTRSQDPLPAIPHEEIPLQTLHQGHTITLDDTEHHADRNYYQNTPTKKKETNHDHSETGDRRSSEEPKYEDVTPVTKRKSYEKGFDDENDFDTGEEDFPDDDRPRVTPDMKFSIEQDLKTGKLG